MEERPWIVRLPPTTTLQVLIDFQLDVLQRWGYNPVTNRIPALEWIDHHVAEPLNFATYYCELAPTLSISVAASDLSKLDEAAATVGGAARQEEVAVFLPSECGVVSRLVFEHPEGATFTPDDVQHLHNAAAPAGLEFEGGPGLCSIVFRDYTGLHLSSFAGTIRHVLEQAGYEAQLRVARGVSYSVTRLPACRKTTEWPDQEPRLLGISDLAPGHPIYARGATFVLKLSGTVPLPGPSAGSQEPREENLPR